MSYYLRFFTIFYPSEAYLNSTNIVIAAVIIISLVIVILIKTQSRKQSSKECISEVKELKNLEVSDTFSSRISDLNTVW